jgi:hypothetical protein
MQVPVPICPHSAARAKVALTYIDGPEYVELTLKYFSKEQSPSCCHLFQDVVRSATHDGRESLREILKSVIRAVNQQNIPVALNLLPRMPETLRNSIFDHYPLSDTTRAPNDEAVVSRIFEMAVEGDKAAIKMRDFLVCVGKKVEKSIRKSQVSLHSDREAVNEQNIPVAQSLLPRMPENLRNSIFDHYPLSDTTRAPNDETVVFRIFEMALEGEKPAIEMCDFLVCVGKIVEKRIRKLKASLRSDREAFARSNFF